MLNIKVVGPGCVNCQKLENLCKEIVTENDVDAKIEKVTDVNQFADLGVFLTPALLIDTKVVVAGKLTTKWTLSRRILDAYKSVP